MDSEPCLRFLSSTSYLRSYFRLIRVVHSTECLPGFAFLAEILCLLCTPNVGPNRLFGHSVRLARFCVFLRFFGLRFFSLALWVQGISYEIPSYIPILLFCVLGSGDIPGSVEWEGWFGSVGSVVCFQ